MSGPWPWGRALVEADEMLSAHLDDALAVFGSAALGVVDLPPLSSAGIVPAQVRVAAVLYWARELEEAGLIPFVESLARSTVDGRLPVRGNVGGLLSVWRSARYRFGPVERRALFSRLFGGSGSEEPNASFDPAFRATIEALASVGRAGTTEGLLPFETRARVTASALGSDLSGRAVGIAAFAARDIVQQARTAVRLLRQPAITSVLGTGAPWELVRRHGPSLLGRPVSPQRPLVRAEAGMRVIAWIAESAPQLEAGTAALGRGHPVLAEAERWLASAPAAVA